VVTDNAVVETPTFVIGMACTFLLGYSMGWLVSENSKPAAQLALDHTAIELQQASMALHHAGQLVQECRAALERK
jgi:ABC-type dipeptide/oligopeptide/nickel transport system permease component